jgi:hypothetical protein
MLLDVVREELDAVLRQARKIITEWLPDEWRWIIVPLTVEIEGSTRNWHEKKPLEV